jgi:hypothetical protein
MATIVYLDAEDEITSAASRIRAAADSRVGLVIPFGSRVATSRINFRLLAREAMSHGRRLDIVAPDASARALAASAGLPVFASVGEYEEALDEDEEKDARGRPRARRRAHRRCAVAEVRPCGRNGTCHPAEHAWRGRFTTRHRPRFGQRRTRARRRAADRRPARRGCRGRRGCRRHRPSDTDLYDAPGAVGVHDPLARRAARRPRAPAGRRLGAIIGTLLVLVVVVGAVGVGAYLLPPSASITVRPRIGGPRPVRSRCAPTHGDLGRRGRGTSCRR